MTNPSPLDHTAYPHLLDAIVAFAPPDSLVALRAVSRALRDRADRLLVENVLITTDKVTTGDGQRIPRAAWWDEPDLLGCVRVVTIETRGGKWVTTDGTGPSASLSCLRAMCDGWIEPEFFQRQDDTMGVRLIRTRRGPSGDGDAEPSRTVVLHLRRQEHPQYPSFQEGIDKLVLTTDLGNWTYWRPDYDLDLAGTPQIVVHFTNTGVAHLDAWDRRMLGRKAVLTGTTAVRAWAAARRHRKPRLTFVGVEEVFPHIRGPETVAGFWPTVRDGFSTMMPWVPLTDGLDDMAESVPVAEYRKRFGDEMFRLETEM